jgi:glycosyltransferase involved in cell wall biosynthesis
VIKAQIVIPCFNEAESLSRLFAECQIVVKESQQSINFILVDNGSTDGTFSFFEQHKDIDSGVTFLSVTPNRGYGGGIVAGLNSTTSERIGWTHADLQTPLTDCIRGMALLDSGYDFVKGSRRGRPFLDRFFSSGMAFFESYLFSASLKEINAQPTIFTQDVYTRWSDIPIDFSIDLYALVMATKENLRVARFPVEFLPRIHGESKWNSGFKDRIRFVRRTISYSLRLKRIL